MPKFESPQGEDLRNCMARLCCDALRLAREGRTHSDIFHALADAWDLYDPSSRAPIWLSRLVAGVQSDHDKANPSLLQYRKDC
jgi:hypothetical protein